MAVGIGYVVINWQAAQASPQLQSRGHRTAPPLQGPFFAHMSPRSQQRPGREPKLHLRTAFRAAQADASCKVVSQTMRDAQVQFTAREFSKEIG